MTTSIVNTSRNDQHPSTSKQINPTQFATLVPNQTSGQPIASRQPPSRQYPSSNPSSILQQSLAEAFPEFIFEAQPQQIVDSNFVPVPSHQVIVQTGGSHGSQPQQPLHFHSQHSGVILVQNQSLQSQHHHQAQLAQLPAANNAYYQMISQQNNVNSSHFNL